MKRTSNINGRMLTSLPLDVRLWKQPAVFQIAYTVIEIHHSQLCFGSLLTYIFQNIDWFIMDSAERAQHFAESISFVFCSQLAVCCS